MGTNKEWFLRVEEKDHQNQNFPDSLVIEKIAEKSPADELELEIGDTFVSINGRPALLADIPSMLIEERQAEYVFYRERSKKLLTVLTPALPLGIRTQSSSEDIVTTYTTKPLQDAEGILVLWERGDYEHIRRACSNAISRSLLGKLLPKLKNEPLAQFLQAVCDIEQYASVDAYEIIESFSEEHADSYTSSVISLVSYYRAIKAQSEGKKSTFDNLIRYAVEATPDSVRLKRVADEGNVSYFLPGARLGNNYSLNYGMAYLEGGTEVASLSKVVASLTEDQLLPICFMLTYRGNGPYNDNLKVYRSIYPHIKNSIQPMFVITSVAEKEADRPHWFEAEEALIEAGIPLIIAHDPSAFFADSILSGAPEYIAVDKNSKVIWDDSFHDDYAYWEAISKLPTPS